MEIVDTLEKINLFVETVERLFEESKAGGLITMEKADVIRYQSAKKSEDKILRSIATAKQ